MRVGAGRRPVAWAWPLAALVFRSLFETSTQGVIGGAGSGMREDRWRQCGRQGGLLHQPSACAALAWTRACRPIDIVAAARRASWTCAPSSSGAWCGTPRWPAASSSRCASGPHAWHTLARSVRQAGGSRAFERGGRVNEGGRRERRLGCTARSAAKHARPPDHCFRRPSAGAQGRADSHCIPVGARQGALHGERTWAVISRCWAAAGQAHARNFDPPPVLCGSDPQACF